MAVRIVKHEDTIAVRCPDLAKELVSYNTKGSSQIKRKSVMAIAHISIANGKNFIVKNKKAQNVHAVIQENS